MVSAVRNLCQEWTQIASNDERDLLRLRSPTPGNPAPTVMGHYCLQNAARRVHGSAREAFSPVERTSNVEARNALHRHVLSALTFTPSFRCERP